MRSSTLSLTTIIAVTGDLEKAAKPMNSGCKSIRETWCRTLTWVASTRHSGNLTKPLRASSEAHRLEVSGLSYCNLIDGYINLNRSGRGPGHSKEAQAKNIRFFGPALSHFTYSPFCRTMPVGMKEQVDWAAGKPGVKTGCWALEAKTATYFGKR